MVKKRIALLILKLRQSKRSSGFTAKLIGVHPYSGLHCTIDFPAVFPISSPVDFPSFRECRVWVRYGPQKMGPVVDFVAYGAPLSQAKNYKMRVLVDHALLAEAKEQLTSCIQMDLDPLQFS